MHYDAGTVEKAGVKGLQSYLWKRQYISWVINTSFSFVQNVMDSGPLRMTSGRGIQAVW